MRSFGLFLLLVGCSDGATFHTPISALGSSTSDDGSEDHNDGDQTAVTDGGDESSDEPAWVNGSYLTCSWQSAVTPTDASIACSVKSPNGGELFAKADATWQAALQDGTVLVQTSTPAGDSLRTDLVLSANMLPSVIISVVSGPSRLANPIVEILPGFDDPADLASCLNGSSTLTLCLQTVGIYIQGGDPVPLPPPAPAPGLPAQRVAFNGVPYYLGDAGQSCDEVCLPAGGPRPETVTVIGTSGTAIGCVDVLSQFGFSSVYDGQTASDGVGCHVFNGGGTRVTNPLTTHGAKSSGARRVCSCEL